MLKFTLAHEVMPDRKNNADKNKPVIRIGSCVLLFEFPNVPASYNIPGD